MPDGNPDQIKATMTDDQAQSAQLVKSGQYMYDENILPTDQLAQYKSKYGDQIKFFTTPSTYYFFMNQRLAPFNNLKARQAVNYAIDRQQLVNLAAASECRRGTSCRRAIRSTRRSRRRPIRTTCRRRSSSSSSRGPPARR